VSLPTAGLSVRRPVRELRGCRSPPLGAGAV
jgi:hypothetical protein